MIPALISAGAGIIGGLLNKSSSDQANATNQANALRQEALQREFAQSGIQWKVADAEKAGIHPLYALGANTVSYSPNTVGAVADTSMGSALSSAGQDISRAMAANSDNDGRKTLFDTAVQKLTLQRMGLENENLASDLAKKRAQIGPPIPSLTDKNEIPGQPITQADVNLPKPGEKRAYNLGANFRIKTNPGDSQQDALSKEYGDEGLPQIPGQLRFLRDTGRSAYHHYETWMNNQIKEIRDEVSRLYGGRVQNPQRRFHNRGKW